MSEFDVALIKLLAVNLNKSNFVDPKTRIWVLEQLSTYSVNRIDLDADEINQINSAIEHLKSSLPKGRH